MQRLFRSRSRCHRTARELQAYLDGEVSPPSARAVAEHLEECRRCGMEAETYAAIKTAVAARAGGASGDHADVAPDVLERLDRFARALVAQG
jgi:anti-sigma factor RsiW